MHGRTPFQPGTKPLILLLIPCWLMGCGKREPLRPIDWAESFAGAMLEARQSGQPVMVAFYVPESADCQALDQQTLTDPKVIEATRAFIAVSVNGLAERATAEQFNVSSFPTVVFLDSTGHEMARCTGFVSPEEFLRVVEKAKRSR